MTCGLSFGAGKAAGKRNRASCTAISAADAPQTTSPAKPYAPTAEEQQRIDAALARSGGRRHGPPMKLRKGENGGVHFEVQHDDTAIGDMLTLDAFGASDSAFLDGLLGQIVTVASPGNEIDAVTSNFMISIVKGIEPRDQVEAMLAAQMAAVHMASMTFARRLAHVDNIPQQDSAERAFNKLTRTFAAQMSALKDYRSRGEQRMTVQHVHVAEGGQAIVGNITASKEGDGACGKLGEQPHALGYATGEALPCELEAERETLPSASGAGL